VEFCCREVGGSRRLWDVRPPEHRCRDVTWAENNSISRRNILIAGGILAQHPLCDQSFGTSLTKNWPLRWSAPILTPPLALARPAAAERPVVLPPQRGRSAVAQTYPVYIVRDVERRWKHRSHRPIAAQPRNHNDAGDGRSPVCNGPRSSASTSSEVRGRGLLINIGNANRAATSGSPSCRCPSEKLSRPTSDRQ
jgi:hypothetical protein